MKIIRLRSGIRSGTTQESDAYKQGEYADNQSELETQKTAAGDSVKAITSVHVTVN
jgi:hypothetical protein